MIIYLIGVFLVFVLCTLFLLQDLDKDPITIKELFIVILLSSCSWIGVCIVVLLMIAEATYDHPFWDIIIVPKRKNK